MRIITIGEAGHKTIYNPNFIVRISKGKEGYNPCIKILTVSGTCDTVRCKDEVDFLKKMDALEKEMCEA
jgi:hypothetical protein